MKGLKGNISMNEVTTVMDKWNNESKAFTQIPFVNLDNFRGWDSWLNSWGTDLGEFGTGDGECLLNVWQHGNAHVVLTSGNGYPQAIRHEACGLPVTEEAGLKHGDSVLLPIYCASVEDLLELVCQLQLIECTDNDEFGIGLYLQKRRNEVYDERWGTACTPA